MLPGQPEVGGTPPGPQAIEGLEQRLAALEDGAACGEDFDAASVAWLALLGVVMPALMLLAGWFLQ